MIIAIEGIDASGKATLCKSLVAALTAPGRGGFAHGGAVWSFPRYDSPSGRAIKTLLEAGGADPLILQSLQTINRYEVAAEMGALAADPDYALVLDRYFLSGIVYGRVAGLSREWLEAVHTELPQPDLWLLVDIPVEVSFARRPERRDAYERDAEFLRRVRNAYIDEFWHRSISGGGAWAAWTIDGTDPPELVLENAVDAVRQARRRRGSVR